MVYIIYSMCKGIAVFSWTHLTFKRKLAALPKYNEMVKEAISRFISPRHVEIHHEELLRGRWWQVSQIPTEFPLGAWVKDASLKQSKGTGASGSFCLGQATGKMPNKKVAKKPAA